MTLFSRYIPITLGLVFIMLCSIALDRHYQPAVTAAELQAVEEYRTSHDKPTPPHSFTHDGCTLFPNTTIFAFLQTPCFHHDIAYYHGGTPSERKAADRKLRADIADTGLFGQVLAYPVYIGVRLFGDSPLTRAVDAEWGYGHHE